MTGVSNIVFMRFIGILQCGIMSHVARIYDNFVIILICIAYYNISRKGGGTLDKSQKVITIDEVDERIKEHIQGRSCNRNSKKPCPHGY